SSSVPWIYMAQLWHTLKEDGSKYRLKFMLDRKELSLTLDDFRTIFYLPQATNNNHDTVENIMQDIFQMLNNACHWMGSTTIADNALMYCFINNIHVDYTKLLWEGIHYSLLHSTSLIPYPRFTKIIFGHYMTNFPKISRRARDKYHNLKDNDLIKNIFNSRRYKDKVGMKIPDWMISEEMKQTKHYRISIHLTTPAPVTMVDKADELILQDTLQVSLAEHKSRQEQEARENVALVEEHLASVEIEKMVEGQENVVDDSLIPRNAEYNILGTRLEPRSDKESSKVKFTDVVIPVNVYGEHEEENEITDEVYELKRREKGKNVDEFRITRFPTPIRFPKIHTDLELHGHYGYFSEDLRAKFMPGKSFVTLAAHLHKVIADSLHTMVDKNIKEQVQQQVPESYLSRHILHVHPAQPQTTFISEQQYQPYLSMKDDPQLQQQDIAIWLALQMKFERLQCKAAEDIKVRAYVSRESSSGQHNVQEQGPSTLGNQEQVDGYDFWTNSYALNNDEMPTKQVSQDIMEEVSLNIDKAKLKKIADEMLRQRCTSGDEHQYHIDQMKNFLKSDINPHENIFYIRKQKEPGKPKEVIYLNSKIIQVIKTYWELGHVHKFITKIIARRANECVVSITEPDFKNLNKNDIEDIYLLIINGKVGFRVGSEIATPNVKHGYIQRDLTKDKVEYLKLFEEEIEVSKTDEKLGV
nr:hypothetical protein [Tanacetum cinerariifolium]